MKRYLLFLFTGDDMNENLGWRAFHASYDTVEAAKQAFTEYTEDDEYYYGHIVDTQLDEKRAVLLINNGGEWEDAHGYA